MARVVGTDRRAADRAAHHRARGDSRAGLRPAAGRGERQTGPRTDRGDRRTGGGTVTRAQGFTWSVDFTSFTPPMPRATWIALASSAWLFTIPLNVTTPVVV